MLVYAKYLSNTFLTSTHKHVHVIQYKRIALELLLLLCIGYTMYYNPYRVSYFRFRPLCASTYKETHTTTWWFRHAWLYSTQKLSETRHFLGRYPTWLGFRTSRLDRPSNNRPWRSLQIFLFNQRFRNRLCVLNQNFWCRRCTGIMPFSMTQHRVISSSENILLPLQEIYTSRTS